MRKILLVGVVLLLVIFTPHAYAQNLESSHTFYKNAYYFQKGANWYATTLEYHREEENRIYFGGFISSSNDESQIGRWISGSIPKNKIEVVKKNFDSPQVVY